MKKIISFSVAMLLGMMLAHAQYISEVLEYKPAPGQFINETPWGTPASSASITGNINGSMSLGAFGGYVIFKFDQPVANDPNNPFGVDFTIFGNPQNTWHEQGVVSVMRDDNGNGQPDDTWYELAGSDYYFTSTKKGYEVTYKNPNAATNVPWADNDNNTGFIKTNPAHTQPYYPQNNLFPGVNYQAYKLRGTCLADEVNLSNPAMITSPRSAFGYADNNLRGEAPYTIPDNPYTYENENSGGDAFDIDWAVDEAGFPALLSEIDFVKVHTGILADGGMLGEISTEITGAVDVEANSTITGVVDMVVIKNLPDTIKGNTFQLEAMAFNKGRLNEGATLSWSTTLNGATVSNSNLLSFNQSGDITLTAALGSNPAIKANATTYLQYSNPNGISNTASSQLALYPNPAVSTITLQGVQNGTVEIYNGAGHLVQQIASYQSNQPLPIQHLPHGLYIIRYTDAEHTGTARFIKQ